MNLVEAMIPIGILGVLGLVLAVNVHFIYEDAQAELTQLQMKRVEMALEVYAVKHDGAYPTSADGLEPVAPYLPESWDAPLDAWERELVYCSNGQAFDLISLGRDGRVGGEGNDADIRMRDLRVAAVVMGLVPAARASAVISLPAEPERTHVERVAHTWSWMRTLRDWGGLGTARDGWGNPFLSCASGGAPETVSLGADGVRGGTGVDADLYSWTIL